MVELYVFHCNLHVDLDLLRREKKLLWGRALRREKKLLFGPVRQAQVPFLIFCDIGSPCVPKRIPVQCVSTKSASIPSPSISATKPDAIQPSPHTHPNHKHNKMPGVIQPSPTPSIATPVPHFVSLLRFSCFSNLANIGCVFVCQVCGSGMEPS